MPPSSSRIPSLDGVRTISIALVVLSHIFIALKIHEPFSLGNLGVRIFFVISGFLITGLLLNEIDKSQTINLKKFYFRRTLRIFPAFYFYLCVMLAATLAGFIVIPLISFVPAFAYLSNYISTKSWFLGHSWSLAVEEQFYLLLPALLLLAGKKRALIILCLVMVASPMIRIVSYHLFGDNGGSTNFVYVFHHNMDALVAGCLLTFLRQTLHAWRPYQILLNTKLFFLVLILIIVAAMQSEHPHLNNLFCISAINIGLALCIDWAVTNHDGLIGRALNSKPMVTLGMMSYSIYLWQQPFLNSNWESPLTTFPLNLIMIGLTASFSYYMIEKNTLRWRQKLEQRLFTPDSSAQERPPLAAAEVT